jgi:hypothetical protein
MMYHELLQLICVELKRSKMPRVPYAQAVKNKYSSSKFLRVANAQLVGMV